MPHVPGDYVTHEVVPGRWEHDISAGYGCER